MGAKFHERLAVLAESNGVKPTKLGTDAGLSTDTVNKWIRQSKQDKNPGRGKELAKLAARYGVTLDWLLGASDDGGPKQSGGRGGAGAPQADPITAMAEVAVAVAEDAGLDIDRAREIVGRVALKNPGIAHNELLLFRMVMRQQPDQRAERTQAIPKDERRSSPARS